MDITMILTVLRQYGPAFGLSAAGILLSIAGGKQPDHLSVYWMTWSGGVLVGLGACLGYFRVFPLRSRSMTVTYQGKIDEAECIVEVRFYNTASPEVSEVKIPCPLCKASSLLWRRPPRKHRELVEDQPDSEPYCEHCDEYFADLVKTFRRSPAYFQNLLDHGRRIGKRIRRVVRD